MDYELVIRCATAADGATIDAGIADGVIAAVAPAGTLTGTAGKELDATGLHILPGGIDPHVHCNEPGRTSWEGFATASAALAVGGMTAFFDMPLNSLPPTVDGDAFDAKLACAQRNSRLDFALWGGLVPGKLDAMQELHARGVIGFKAFMCETGAEEFRPADDATLREGMRRAAALGALVAVHAESEPITAALTTRARASGATDAAAYLASRPPVAELDAIERAIAIAQDTRCALHIVHVSTDDGIELVQTAQARGVDVSWETTAHYLTFIEDDVQRLGTVAKCSPVMHDDANRERLWDHVAGDPRSIVVSDHSPCPLEMKSTADFFDAWGGVSGCQSTLGVLMSAAARGRITLTAALATVSANPAERFGLTSKGAIEVGRDADLSLVDLGVVATLGADQLLYRHRHSPYVGLPLHGEVRHVLARGTAVVSDGRLVDDGHRGRLLRPRGAPTPALP